jgi:DUF1680 family protein
MYAVKEKDVYVNLYISGSANILLAATDGRAATTASSAKAAAVQITQQSNYPWDGNIHLKVAAAKPTTFNLLMRIPGWARGEAIPGGLYKFEDQAAGSSATGAESGATANASAGAITIRVNGVPVMAEMKNGYAVISRTWKKNDSVDLVLPMPVHKVMAMDSVKDDIGKVAMQRGPLVYCAEWVDNNNRTGNLILPENALFTTHYEPGILNGIVTLQTDGQRVAVDPAGLQVTTHKDHIVAIPYYAWANRGKGEMNIWFPGKLTDVELLSK